MNFECWQNSWLDVLYLDILIDADLNVLLSLHLLSSPDLLDQTWSELLRPLHRGCSYLC